MEDPTVAGHGQPHPQSGDQVDGGQRLEELMERYCLLAPEASAILGQGITVETWKTRRPESYIRAFRAQQLRRDWPWLTAGEARRLADSNVTDEVTEQRLDLWARSSTGLSSSALAAFVSGDTAQARAEHRAWDVMAARAERIGELYPQLDRCTVLRVAFGDGQVRWPGRPDGEELAARAEDVRRRWPALTKSGARTAAQYGMTLEELAELRPAQYGKVIQTMELMQRFPGLHRKLARLLARKDAPDEEVEEVLHQERAGREIWAEATAGGDQATLLALEGVIERDLDPQRRHPYIWYLQGGGHVPKLHVLAAFSGKNRGAILGRMKPAHGVPADARDHPLVPVEDFLALPQQGDRVRLVLRDGRAITLLPRRATRFELLAEVKGGASLGVFRHGVWSMQRITTSAPAPRAGRAKGRSKKRS